MSVQPGGAIPRQRGISLIEILFVLGIIGILVGLSLHAVQGSRESARRIRCGNHLKNLSLAALSFESSRGGFPPRVLTAKFPSAVDTSHFQAFSTQVALLPFLDRSTLFHSINISVKFYEPHDLEGVNSTAARIGVDVFICPSDPQGMPRRWGGNSYRGNVGNDPARRDAHGFPDLVEEGAFVMMKPVLPLSEFRDGLSNTLAFSEKPIGSGKGGTYDPYRDWIPSYSTAATATEWIQVCSNLSSDSAFMPNEGETWMLAGAIFTHFFSSAPPNSRIPDCGIVTNMGSGIFAARSYHPGGVNASMSDGAVRWYSSATSVEVWRALGTRAGGEVVDGE